MKIFLKILITFTAFCSCFIVGSAQTPSALSLKEHLINGVSQFSEGEYNQATSSFSNGSTLDGFEDIAAYNLGRSLMETDDVEGATSAFQQAIASSENPELKSQAWFNTGNIALQSEDPEAAVNAYKSALRNSPTNHDARHNLSIANKMLQQQEQQEQEQDGEDGEESDDSEDSEDKEDGDDQDDGEDQDNEDKEDGEDKNDGEDEQESKGEDGKDKEDEKEEQQVEGQISKEEMARILENLENEEAKIQAKLRRQKGKGEKKTIEKQW